MDRFNISVLNYEYKALEPHIFEETMKIHHSKHHKAYVDNLNKHLESSGLYEKHRLEQILLEKDAPQVIKDNAGGHYNHSFFWAIMNPISNKKDIEPELGSAIIQKFCSLDYLIDVFTDKAINVFGSGWVWLVVDNKNELSIVTTRNQDNPIMYNQGIPILCLDVWEHAYYLQYKNVRRDYVSAWWNVVDWKNVNSLYKKFAMKGVNVNVKRNGSINMIIK